ncbi:hypothetical protein AN944_03410 [Shewanella sp. P1-14-1]|uniref:hypothetical protein n=1 Tax=Shewanella sp. P1-14-1 TaxID=1723761 RepID=UPI0006D667CD|nr:hypothetical protein [Shewanella sp. P1-14-1]KPZ68785.1 hypothetical protein AN944_03410 [Shewanella sp. P1-14-1]
MSGTEKADVTEKIKRSIELVSPDELTSEIVGFNELLAAQHQSYGGWELPTIFSGVFDSDVDIGVIRNLEEKLEVANYSLHSLDGENLIFF